MTEQQHHGAEQLPLPLELREPLPAPRWTEALEHENKGDQDTGWWGA